MTVGPFPALKLEAGYVITGTILNPVLGDGWIDAVCWYDFTYTAP